MTELRQNELLGAAAIAMPASGPSVYRGTIDTVYDNVDPQTGDVAQNGLTDDLRPQLSGTLVAAAGQTIKIWSNSHFAGFVHVDTTGHWTFTPGSDLAVNQEYFFQISMTQPGTDTEIISEAFHFTTTTAGGDDTSTPAAATDVQLYDDVGSSQSYIHNGDTTDDNKPTMSGHATAGDVVKIYDTNNHYLGETTVAANGTWSFTPATALADGAHSFTAVVENPINGHDSATSTAINFTVDTAPAVYGIELFDEGFNPTTHMVMSSGIEITSLTGQEFFNTNVGKAVPTGEQCLLDNETSFGITRSAVHVDLHQTGVTSVEFSAAQGSIVYNLIELPSVTFYDATGHIISASSISVSQEVTLGESGLNTWTFTSTSGQNIASFDVNDSGITIGHISWGSAGAIAEQQSVINAGDHDVSMNIDAILQHAQANLLVQDGHEQMVVNGSGAGVYGPEGVLAVDLQGHAAMTDVGHITAGGVQYEVYHLNSNTELLVHDLSLHQTA